jgi:hypothetical protein
MRGGVDPFRQTGPEVGVSQYPATGLPDLQHWTVGVMKQVPGGQVSVRMPDAHCRWPSTQAGARR